MQGLLPHHHVHHDLASKTDHKKESLHRQGSCRVVKFPFEQQDEDHIKEAKFLDFRQFLAVKPDTRNLCIGSWNRIMIM